MHLSLYGSQCSSRSSGKCDEVCWLRSASVLHYVDFRAGQTIHRAVVAVRPLAEGEHSLVLWVPQARHPRRAEAHQHSASAIGGRLPAEATICYILGLPCKVRPKAPEGSTARTRCKGLEAGNGVAHNRLESMVIGAMECPGAVHTRLKVNALLLERPAHRHVIWVCAPVNLQSVLHALQPHYPHPVPHCLWGEHVGGWLSRCRPEDCRHPQELLAAMRHIKKLPVVQALAMVGGPEPPQSLWGVPKPTLSFKPLLAQTITPCPHYVHFWPFRAEQCVDQARQEVILQQRLHVVTVT
mmetsp:Transcript_122987/g.358984  ORF Transcript_122987/g.358984 Transcript_122987/m.358984 type:complete len:297 (-) Transcript_122987:1548-2438(-)